jgi:intein-encoded DNA endonuclease-like protein
MQSTNEKLFTLVEAVERATGVKVHLSTALRWCQHGTNGIKLESLVLGGRRLTSVEAVCRFIEHRTLQSNDTKRTVVSTVASSPV